MIKFYKRAFAISLVTAIALAFFEADVTVGLLKTIIEVVTLTYCFQSTAFVILQSRADDLHKIIIPTEVGDKLATHLIRDTYRCSSRWAISTVVILLVLFSLKPWYWSHEYWDWRGFATRIAVGLFVANAYCLYLWSECAIKIFVARGEQASFMKRSD